MEQPPPGQYLGQFSHDRPCTAWQLIKSYWQSDQRLPAYLFFSIVMVMTVSLVGLDVVFNYWYNYFYDALQAYDQHGVIRLLVVFCMIAAFYIVLAVYRYYISQLFGLRWRRWLTEQFVGRWLQKRSYYLLENFDEKTDNPDQRIQEDVSSLINFSIDLSMGLIGAITTFIAFIYILWQLSGELTLSLGRFGTFHIPGYLVWVGVLYALIGTLLAFKIGRPLVPLNFEQQRREATFRFAAVDLRTHAENVALYRGERNQQSILYRLFGRVLDNWYFIILRQKVLLWFSAGYNQVSVLLPLVVALPNYFDKVFLLGGLIQSLQAFGRVQDSLSFVVNSYPRIAEWQAVAQRLTTFVNHISDAEEKAEKENHLKFRKQPEKTIAVSGVTIHTPRKELLLQNITENFVHGNNYLIKGDSGIGKSTFIRALAGIWPYAAGEVTFPEQQRVMYLPQRPYMPIGTLEEAILFPNHAEKELSAKLESVMRDCNLESFIPRLRETASWSEQLSPGEQQRIAFARVLLHKPDWVFMDESTSMLDVPNEAALYSILKKMLPNCSVVSVGHRPTLESYHDHVIDMRKYSVHAIV
jgi:putative ATP-binding cassette transporter